MVRDRKSVVVRWSLWGLWGEGVGGFLGVGVCGRVVRIGCVWLDVEADFDWSIPWDGGFAGKECVWLELERFKL